MKIDEIVKNSRASQHPIELKKLLEFLKDKEISNILEVGCDKGYSLEIWTNMFPDALIVGLELRSDGIDSEVSERENIIIVGEDSHSPEAVQTINGLFDRFPVDFLFIDGDHTYDSVKKDYELYSQFVRKGGIIAFHDVVIQDNDTVDVYKLWPQITDFQSSFVISEGGTGVGVIVK